MSEINMKKQKSSTFLACLLVAAMLMTTLSLPNALTTIGNGSFSYCEKLDNVSVPYSVTSIGKSAFQNCLSLKKLKISNSIDSEIHCRINQTILIKRHIGFFESTLRHSLHKKGCAVFYFMTVLF